MKKTNKKRIKVPAAANGMQKGIDFRGLAQSATGALDLLTGMFQQSNATSGGEATMQSVMDIGKGAATGAQIGTAIAPGIGTAIGAAGGLLAGAIGKKGRGASMQSFTDYDEGTLNTGLRGLFGSNKKLRKRRSAIRQNAFGNRAAVEGTVALQDDYADIEAQLDANTFEQGGTIPLSLAYVDDGELIQTPDGQVNQIPEQGQPTDSNLISLPEGSKVLSDKLKVPGTKQTFAEMGKKIMSTKRSKGKDIFAQNANKLNEMNNKLAYNKLFNMQEQVKAQRGITPKTKSVVQAAALGDYIKSSIPALGGPITPDKQAELNNLYNLGEKKRQAAIAADRAERRDNLLNNLGNGVSSLTSGVASLAPIMSNLFARDSKPVQTNYNPYAGAVTNRMRNRRFDINPALQDINRNRATSDYNASQINTNTGANLAYRLQSAIASNNAIAGLRSQESNANNAYTAEYANMMNNLGQQYVNAVNMSDDLNARNSATTRNIRRTGLGQLSQWAQNRELMRNQKQRDTQMWPLYERFLQAGFTENDLQNLAQSMQSTTKRKGGRK